MDLVETVYRLTKEFPREEVYGLTSQLRRAAVSKPANIAEGHSPTVRREYAHFLSMAHGSLSELDTPIELATRSGYLSNEQHDKVFNILSETDRMIDGLIRSLGNMPLPANMRSDCFLTSDPCPLTLRCASLATA